MLGAGHQNRISVDLVGHGQGIGIDKMSRLEEETQQTPAETLLMSADNLLITNPEATSHREETADNNLGHPVLDLEDEKSNVMNVGKKITSADTAQDSIRETDGPRELETISRPRGKTKIYAFLKFTQRPNDDS